MTDVQLIQILFWKSGIKGSEKLERNLEQIKNESRKISKGNKDLKSGKIDLGRVPFQNLGNAQEKNKGCFFWGSFPKAGFGLMMMMKIKTCSATQMYFIL